jgi:hypothetical protein
MRYLTVLLLLQITGCEKFTGYDYTTESIGIHSTVHGTIRNTFNREPISQAEMSIGTIHFATDDDGRYSIEYLIGTDEERNKAISVSIHAANYYSLDTSLVIFPPDVQFNLDMIYAAPIIQQVWWGQVFMQPITQTLIFDHQGASTIDSVYTVFYYAKIGSPEIRTDTVGMTFVSQLSDQQRYYQAIGLSEIDNGFGIYGRKINITVSDIEKYMDIITEKDLAAFSDSPLFPIPGENKSPRVFYKNLESEYGSNQW